MPINSGATEQAVKKIKEMLFSGEYAQGDKLPGEIKLSTMLGVGRSSVREALRLLSANGYVEIIPNRGAFVAATSEDDLSSPNFWLKVNENIVDELLTVRSYIEPIAAELCAQFVTEEGLRLMREQLDGFEAALESNDWALLAQYDLDFHHTILKESHNRYLAQMYQPLLDGFMQYSGRSFAATYTKSNTLAEHRAVYNAIEVRSPREARAAMELHISIAKRRAKFEK